MKLLFGVKIRRKKVKTEQTIKAKAYDEIIIIDKHFDAPHVKDEFHYI